MKVIAITSTFPADELREADAVVQKLGQIQIDIDGVGKLAASLR